MNNYFYTAFRRQPLVYFCDVETRQEWESGGLLDSIMGVTSATSAYALRKRLEADGYESIKIKYAQNQDKSPWRKDEQDNGSKSIPEGE